MITVAELEQTLDIVSLLDIWGVDTSTLRPVSRGEYRSHCFLHDGDGDSALAIKFNNGRIYLTCFSHNCWNGTLVDYGISLGKTFGDVIRDYTMCQGESTHTHTRRHGDTVGMGDIVLADNVMEQFEPSIHADIVKLGYDKRLLRDIWDVRYATDPYHTLANRIVYPIRRKDGATVSLQGRISSVYEGIYPKYQFMPNTYAKRYLYGAYENRERIRHSRYIVCAESPKSSWRGYELGIVTLTTMGIRYTEQQVIALASYGKPLILVADNDPSGVGLDGMERLAFELKQYVPVSVRVVPDVKHDISDYRTREEWNEILK